MSTVLSLEDELERVAQKCEHTKAMCSSYQLMKQYLNKNYYDWIQSNLPYFTDHGRGHIESVIHCASQLFSNVVRKKDDLSSFDMFLVLSSIIWHDAGMVSKRSGHQELLAHTMKDIRELAFSHPSAFRLVDSIVKSHTGNEGLQIPDQGYKYTFAPGKDYDVYPQALAGVLRFADEISENRTRVSLPLLRSGKVPEENLIFWHYAASISSSTIEPSRKRAVINFEIQSDVLFKRFPSKEFFDHCDINRSITLIEYIVCRVEKANNERIYCGRHFARYCDLRELVVRISVLDGDHKVPGYELYEISLGDGGLNIPLYPNVPVYESFFDSSPSWRLQALRGQFGDE